MHATTILLGQYLMHDAGRPFDWATRHCCHFAAGWVNTATGSNPMQGLPGVGSLREALRVLRTLGGSLQAAWTLRLGRQPIPPARAQVGDIVLLPLPPDLAADLGDEPGADACTAHTVGICAGLHAVVATVEGDRAYLPMSHAVCAWRLHAEAAPC